MSKSIQILCPEYVPLENKGEEAIIRGTIDVIFPDTPCEYHVVDMNTDKYRFVDGIHVHPGRLFFSDWRSREFGLGLTWHQMYSSACSLLRNVLNRVTPNWVSKPHKQATLLKLYLNGDKQPPVKYQQSVKVLKEVDYIIAGHNGGLNEYVCHLLNELHSIGMPFGVFGSSMKPNLKVKKILDIFGKSFSSSAFNIARNPVGFEWAERNFPESSFKLNPDPAFGMVPESKSKTNDLINQEGLDDFFEKPVVMFTTAEPAPIARHSFEKSVGPEQKVKAHRKFLADLLKLILDNTDCNVLFLPHTIGPDKKMDDRLISKDVIERAGLNNDDRVRLLMADLTAKDLKGLIARADFIVAERVHSIIGAIGVTTPFLCLGSKFDTRVKGIIKMQMDLGDYIYYLADPNPQEAFERFHKCYAARDEFRAMLREKNKGIREVLSATGKELRGIIESTLSKKQES